MRQFCPEKDSKGAAPSTVWLPLCLEWQIFDDAVYQIEQIGLIAALYLIRDHLLNLFHGLPP